MQDRDAPGSGPRSHRVATTAQWLLVAAGTAVALYLVYVHYQTSALVCGIGDCETVQTSRYAELAGIPIAWLGLALYLGIAMALAASARGLIANDIAEVLVVGATFAGTLAVAYLTYLEIWVIEAICQWCVAFAIITGVLFVLSALRLRGTLAETAP